VLGEAVIPCPAEVAGVKRAKVAKRHSDENHRAAVIRVKSAAKAKHRSDKNYRAAVIAALAAGVSYIELAQVLGVSRQAVRQLARRAA
jgi:DNA-directed RNA polymerase specialized sigma24 family protein